MPTQPRGASLVYSDYHGVARTVPLGPQAVTLGRSRDNVVAFPRNEGVSRYHAEVVTDGAGFIVIDRGSAHGTFVNGTRVEAHRLVDDDTVALGVVDAPVLRFEDAAAISTFSDGDDPWTDEPMTL